MNIRKNKKLGIAISVIALCFLIASYFYLKSGISNVLPAFLPAKNLPNPNLNDTNKTNGLISGNFTGIPLSLIGNLRIDFFAKDLGKPRDLIEDSRGNILVSIPERGQVVALLDSDSNGISNKSQIILEKLKQPHGLAFSGNTLFIAETDKVVSYSYDPVNNSVIKAKKIFDLPGGSTHWSRSLLVAKYNGKEMLFVSTGSSCNACEESDPRRAAVWYANLDGTEFKSFSSGLRNSVFLTTHPRTGEIWATDNGRDRIGDDIPPEEVNILKEGGFYGWPYCYGRNILDRTVAKDSSLCANSIKPHIEMQAHSAPLGLAFIPTSFGELEGDLLVAFHGSWNRSVPTGYKIVRIKLSEQGEYQGIEDFISGWLPGTNSAQSFGRPVDILFSKNGIGYISDDKAGVVYRLEYVK